MLHWLPSTTTATHVTNKADAENLLLETLFSTCGVKSSSRGDQARSVKQFVRASTFKMWFFPFSLVVWSHRHLRAPVCATLGDRLYRNICESHEKFTRRQKPWAQPHKAHLLAKFRCPGSTNTQCCSGGVRQSQVGESPALAPSHGHRLKAKAVTKPDREIQPVSPQHQCQSVSLCLQRT